MRVWRNLLTSVMSFGDWLALLSGLLVIEVMFVGVAQPADKCHNLWRLVCSAERPACYRGVVCECECFHGFSCFFWGGDRSATHRLRQSSNVGLWSRCLSLLTVDFSAPLRRFLAIHICGNYSARSMVGGSAQVLPIVLRVRRARSPAANSLHPRICYRQLGYQSIGI